jgi:glucokinase
MTQSSSHRYSIGVDIGGTKVLGGIVDRDGSIIHSSRKDTPRDGGHALVTTIADVIDELLTYAKSKTIEIPAIGICTAGVISPDRRTVSYAPNIAGWWEPFDLVAALSSRISLPMFVENDANAAVWGEYKFGAALGKHNVVLLTIGTGLGGGIIVDGQIVRGAHGGGAEIGHTCLVYEGHLCGCGGRGCFESYGSGTALLRHAREAISASPELARNLLSRGNGTVDGLLGKHLTEAAQEGDRVALAAFTTTGQWIGVGIASLVALLDPECFIIGGGVIDAGEIILKPIRESAQRNMPFSGRVSVPPIIPAVLGNDAGLVGAADLAR